jgi:hypothetical protein
MSINQADSTAYNTAYTLRAYALAPRSARGTLPSATSYMLKTLSEIGQSNIMKIIYLKRGVIYYEYESKT